MAIIRFDPIRLQSRLLRPFFEEDEIPDITMTDGLNIYEENNNVVVEAAVPGIPEDKIEVTYEDGVLHIRGHSEEKEQEKKKNRIIHRMQRITSFDYTTYLPRPIDEKKIQATVKDGVLTITAPIAKEAQPKRITVKMSSKK